MARPHLIPHPSSTSERVLLLEERFRQVSVRLDDMDTKLTAIHTLLTKAKGVKGFVVTAFAAIGSIASIGAAGAGIAKALGLL